MEIIRKAKKWLKRTVNDWKNDSTFSKKFASYRLFYSICRKLKLNSLAEKLKTKKNKWINHYLTKFLSSTIQKYKDIPSAPEVSQDAPIWVCWWTGEDTAPDIVKQCIKSIRKNAGTHPVYFISEKNYSDYLIIPEYIFKNMETGDMALAHFADYIRIALLAKYGGIWIDSTIFVSQKIPDSVFDYPLYTCKGPLGDNGYTSQGRWTTFLIAGYKNEKFFLFIKEALEKYWYSHKKAIDYLFFDELFEIAYNNFSDIKEIFDNIPENNLHRDDLQAAMNARIPGSAFHEIVTPDTSFYKLSWRESYSKTTVNGEESLYKYFLEGVE